MYRIAGTFSDKQTSDDLQFEGKIPKPVASLRTFSHQPRA